MAATKRATWIEGITKSGRILRDLSEIFTSANRDDMGISKKENWELVYPRPFEEYNVVRGTLLQDGSQTRHYTHIMNSTQCCRYIYNRQTCFCFKKDIFALNKTNITPTI